jgi:uncharacterized DUF497 family protein
MYGIIYLSIKFEWDDEKDKLNQKKHGVSFREAQRAFLDRHRIVAEDLEHTNEYEEFKRLFIKVFQPIVSRLISKEKYEDSIKSRAP